MFSLYNMDCFELIKSMPEKSVDLVVTDPPYEVSGTTGGGSINKVKKLDKSLQDLVEADIADGYDIETFGEEILRVMKEPNIYFWCNKIQIPAYFDFWVNKHKCKFDIINWHKCLHTETKIKILDNNNRERIVTLGQLYFLGLKEHPVTIFDGTEWVKIEDIVPKYDVDHYFNIILKNGKNVKCTFEHRFSVNNELKQAKELNIGDILDNIYNEDSYEIENIIICKNKEISLFYDLCLNNESHMFALENGVLTHNSNALPTYSNKYLSDTEYCLYFRKGKGKCYPQSYEDAKTFYIAPLNQKDKKLYGHPTPKPVDIIEKLVRNSSREGDVVFDPFTGSGSTGEACLRNNRNFIGSELNTTYYETAKARLENVEKELGLSN